MHGWWCNFSSRKWAWNEFEHQYPEIASATGPERPYQGSDKGWQPGWQTSKKPAQEPQFVFDPEGARANVSDKFFQDTLEWLFLSPREIAPREPCRSAPGIGLPGDSEQRNLRGDGPGTQDIRPEKVWGREQDNLGVCKPYRCSVPATKVDDELLSVKNQQVAAYWAEDNVQSSQQARVEFSWGFGESDGSISSILLPEFIVSILVFINNFVT